MLFFINAFLFCYVILIINNNCIDASPTLNRNQDFTKHKNANLLPNECGRIQSNDRIGFGNNAVLDEFPWMVALMLNGNNKTFYCGGSLINEEYVLTAAHCLTNRKPTESFVRLGESDFDMNPDCDKKEDYCTQPYQDVRIKKFKIHPNFNHTIAVLTDDIALIQIERIKFNKQNIEPVCLPLTSKSINSNLDNLLIIGWGKSETGLFQTKLQRAAVKLGSFDQCEAFYKTQFNSDQYSAKLDVNNEKHLCTIGHSYSCHGDSGGPVQNIIKIGHEAKYFQQAITSFGPETACGRSNPVVNTRIVSYMDWILDNIKD